MATGSVGCTGSRGFESPVVGSTGACVNCCPSTHVTEVGAGVTGAVGAGVGVGAVIASGGVTTGVVGAGAGCEVAVRALRASTFVAPSHRSFLLAMISCIVGIILKVMK